MKIGDFGLATAGIMQPSGSVADFSLSASALEAAAAASGSESAVTADDGLTGKVGTALYVSPEIMDEAKKLHYTQVCEQACSYLSSYARILRTTKYPLLEEY